MRRISQIAEPIRMHANVIEAHSATSTVFHRTNLIHRSWRCDHPSLELSHGEVRRKASNHQNEALLTFTWKTSKGGPSIVSLTTFLSQPELCNWPCLSFWFSGGI